MALALAAVSGAGAACAWFWFLYPDQPGPGSGKTVALQVPKGASARGVAEQLAHEGLVDLPRLWALYARLMDADKRLRSGEVLLHDRMSPRELVQRLTERAGPKEVRVTVPEGFTRFDIAAQLQRMDLCASEDFLRATQDAELLSQLQIPAQSAEGYLFPDTYRLHHQLSARALVRRMVKNWQARVLPLLEHRVEEGEQLRRDLGWGVHEVMVLASIVEKEAALRSERPVIAGVFLNRLRSPDFRPKRLQADPTVAYGCLISPASAPSCSAFDGKRVTRSMMEDPGNPYNTYWFEGLPPGPIANPGLDAVRAVLQPAQHPYLYFVAESGGRHHFSATLTEHNRAVQRYREAMQRDR